MKDLSGAEHFNPVLLLTANPSGVFQYSIEQALKTRGLSVITAGPQETSPFADAVQRYDPGYGMDIVCNLDEPLEAILARCQESPRWILYFESTCGFLPLGLERVEIPTVALMTEDYIHADWLNQLFPLFDLVLSAWRRTAELYSARGHDNVVQWYFGARAPFHRDLGLERIYDVAFLGNLEPNVQRERNRVVERLIRLRRQGLKCLAAWGAWIEDYNRLHAQTKIVYHHSITKQINMRVFEAMAAGCLVVCHRPEDHHDPTSHIFTHGEDIVFVDSDEEALEVVRYYLEHDEERERIARAGRDKVVAHHNYENTLDDLFEHLPAHLDGDFVGRRRERLKRWGFGPEEVRFAYGYFYTYNQFPSKARAQFEAAGDGPEVLNALGMAAMLEGDFPGAVEFFEKALALRPSFALARCNLATAHMVEHQGRSSSEEARRKTEEALKALADEGLSEADLEGPALPNNYDRFRLEISKAFVDHPPGPERRQALAGCLKYQMSKYMAMLAMERSDWDEVERYALDALVIFGDDGYVMSGLAQAYCSRGRYDDAVAILRKAVELEPFHSEAQINLARLYHFLGKTQEAIARLVDSLELNPLFGPFQVQALNDLGTWLQEAGRGEDALSCLRESLRLDPNQAQIKDLLESQVG